MTLTYWHQINTDLPWLAYLYFILNKKFQVEEINIPLMLQTSSSTNLMLMSN